MLLELFRRLGDDGAGDARRRGAAGFGGHGVDHHRSATVAEDGVAVGAKRDVRGDDGCVSGAVRADDQREVGNVTRREAAGVIVARAVRIEVGSGGFKVGPVALCELMDVQGVLAGREILDVELDADTV